LRTLSDASSNWSNGRTAKQRQPQWPPSSKPDDNRSQHLVKFTDRIASRISRDHFQINCECQC
jgi:hypothetical protein